MKGKFLMLIFLLTVTIACCKKNERKNLEKGSKKIKEEVRIKDDKKMKNDGGVVKNFERIKKNEKENEAKDREENENVNGESDDDDEDSVDTTSESDESYEEENENMKFCLNRENVTESQMKNFLINNTNEDKNEPLKKAIFCFLKKMNFFDGKTWNVKVISETIEENSIIFKTIRECLKKDDKTLAPHERTYKAQKCILNAKPRV